MAGPSITIMAMGSIGADWEGRGGYRDQPGQGSVIIITLIDTLLYISHYYYAITLCRQLPADYYHNNKYVNKYHHQWQWTININEYQQHSFIKAITNNNGML